MAVRDLPKVKAPVRFRYPAHMEKEPVNASAELANKLKRGETSPDVFLKSLFELDQSTPERANCFDNIEVLKDPAVEAYFTGGELRNDFSNLLSLSRFHAGQNLLAKGSAEEALHHFEAALEAASMINDQEFQYWKDYIEGTIFYAKKDIGSLRSVCNRMAYGDNRTILLNLLRSLEENQGGGYLKDSGSE